MINLYTFIKQCESDLTSKRVISESTLLMFHELPKKYKILCEPMMFYELIEKDKISWEPMINIFTRHSTNVKVNGKDITFLPEERILVCRLIPLRFALDTDNPGWSSYLLTKYMKAATNIVGIQLSEILIAYIEIFCEFETPLNRFTYNFCWDLIKEFSIHYEKRFNEFELLKTWNYTRCEILPIIAFLKYMLVPLGDAGPKLLLRTIITLLGNEYFAEFAGETKYQFEDLEFKKEFQQILLSSELSDYQKNIIFSVFEL